MDRAQGRRLKVGGGSGWTAALVLAAGLLARGAWAQAPSSGQAPASGGPGGQTFAVIVNGDDSFTHDENVAMALAALPRLGYERRNILVLAPEKAVEIAASMAVEMGVAGGEEMKGQGTGEPIAKGSEGAVRGAGEGFWRREATAEGIEEAIGVLRQRMRSGDVLLVYLTGHAYRSFGQTALGLRRGTMRAGALMQRFGELPFGRMVLIADPCYSGGFVQAAMALGRNVVAVASTDDRHEVRCEPFVRPLWLAAIEAAGSAGRFVSLEAAFEATARGRRAAGDSPQYASSGSCAGHENSFAGVAAPSLAAAPAGAAGSLGLN